MRTQSLRALFCFLLLSPALAAQTRLNPPYLAEMPSVDRVMREIRGTDATDTLNRQMGAFVQLNSMIEDAAGPRRFRNQLTPDETRMIRDYTDAYERLHRMPRERRSSGYDVDPQFRDELFTQFGMNQLRRQFQQTNADYEAKHQARIQSEQQQFEAAKARQAEGPGNTTDPGTLAARRCAAAGRSLMECLSEGMSKDITTVAPSLARKPAPAGPRLNGVYQGPSGFAVVLSPGTAYDSGWANVRCGKLEGASGVYTIALKNGAVIVTVPNQPNAISFNLRPDGNLAGPASAQIDGRIIVGYKQGGPVTKTENHMAGEPVSAGDVQTGKYNLSDVQRSPTGQYSLANSVTTTTTVQGGPSPIYQPKTEQCAIGSLTSAGPATSTRAPLAAGVASLAGAAANNVPVPAGLRMGGVYQNPEGAHLEFRGDIAILDCGDVQLAPAYTVGQGSGQLLIRMKGEQPVDLVYHPDGTLSGPGRIRINGRVMVGQGGNGQIAYAPRAAMCSLASLTPVGP